MIDVDAELRRAWITENNAVCGHIYGDRKGRFKDGQLPGSGQKQRVPHVDQGTNINAGNELAVIPGTLAIRSEWLITS